MKRDLRQLADNSYDLVVVGGGIYGACVAWDATLRGLRVALIERADFCGATSANSSKIIHGGLRYLQNADLRRMRESIGERRTLMRIAPHLVHPMPVVIPTYGHGMRGKEALSLALALNDLISFDRNRLDDPQKQIPRGRIISRRECLDLLPGIREKGLTGCALFHDAQMYSSERLVLSFLHSAEKAGARLANYVAATGFLREGDCLTGVEAEDVLTGNRFDVRARIVVNTAGPWVDAVLGLLRGHRPRTSLRFARAINLITRPLFEGYAAGLDTQCGYRDGDALVNRGNRLLFFTPWRGHTLVGTSYVVHKGAPDEVWVVENDVQDFLDEINRAYPPAKLTMDDVSFVHSGLLPISGADVDGRNVRLTKRYQIHDHRIDGLAGLISVVGVKYTTARQVAEKAVDTVFAALERKAPRSTSSTTPLHGGRIERFEAFLSDVMRRRPGDLKGETVRHLICNYGSAYGSVLRYLPGNDGGPELPESLAVLRAEILNGIHEEMAHKLTDIVLRRTELGTAGDPGDETLGFCAEVMAEELGWGPARVELELREATAATRGALTGVRRHGYCSSRSGRTPG